MALIATVTKKSVVITSDNRYDVTFNLLLKDENVEVFTENYSCRYRLGDNISSKLIIIGTNMQKSINDYKAQKVVFNSTVLNNAVISIQNGLTF